MERILTSRDSPHHQSGQLTSAIGGNSSQAIAPEKFVESLDINVFEHRQPQRFLDDVLGRLTTDFSLTSQIDQIEFLENVFVKLDALQPIAEGNDEFCAKAQSVKNGLLSHIRSLDPRHKLNDQIFSEIGVLELPERETLQPPPDLSVKARNDRIDFYRRSIDRTQSQPQEITSSAIQGFANLSNTCYANATLKTLIISIGAEELERHLRKLLKNSPPTHQAAINAFFPVIAGSSSSKGPLKDELATFFETLQKTDPFKHFKLIGREQDPHEFLSKLSEIFKLDQIKGRQITKIENYAREGKEDFANASVEWKLESNVSSDITLQAMWDELLKDEEVDYRWDGDDRSTETTKAAFYALDTSVGNGVFHHINAMSYGPLGASKIELTQLKVNAPVTFRCRDINDKKHYELTLEARDITVHSGSANSGHYYTVAKRKDGKWDVHNDARVYTVDNISNREQAKLINYVITNRKAIG